jgi:hypothetical protein
LSFLESVSVEAATQLQALVRTRQGVQALDLSSAVDPSYPITSSFDLVPLSATVAIPPASLGDLEAFLKDATASWRPFTADVPVDRTGNYLRDIDSMLAACVREGSTAAVTAWLSVDSGSGTTTLLRQLALAVARRGYPVLVAKRDSASFDFRQLAAFLTAAGERYSRLAPESPELPWLIVFDSDHVVLHGEFVSGLASGLKNLLRPSVVLAARYGDNAERAFAHGINRELKPRFQNTVSEDEAKAVGRHFARYLPEGLRRKADAWGAFAEQAVVTGIDGRTSLFWVALRFWLFDVSFAGESLRTWLAGKLTAAAQSSEKTLAPLLGWRRSHGIGWRSPPH